MISKTTIKNIFSSNKHERFGTEEKAMKESFKHQKFDNAEIQLSSATKNDKIKKFSFVRKYEQL